MVLALFAWCTRLMRTVEEAHMAIETQCYIAVIGDMVRSRDLPRPERALVQQQFDELIRNLNKSDAAFFRDLEDHRVIFLCDFDSHRIFSSMTAVVPCTGDFG